MLILIWQKLSAAKFWGCSAIALTITYLKAMVRLLARLHMIGGAHHIYVNVVPSSQLRAQALMPFDMHQH